MNTNRETLICQDLVNFIVIKTGFSNPTTISSQTTINYDIGLDGDDADEFMEAYFDHFMVECGNYDWSRYFGEEGFNPISVLIEILKRKPVPKPLSFGMLKLAAKMGKWDTEILEQAYLNNNYAYPPEQ